MDESRRDVAQQVARTRSSASGWAQVIPLRGVPCIDEDVDRLGAALGRLLHESEKEEANGPHLVIARGAVDRYFGPFATGAEAAQVAAAEAEEWARELPESEVTFHVAPLVDANQLSRAPGDF